MTINLQGASNLFINNPSQYGGVTSMLVLACNSWKAFKGLNTLYQQNSCSFWPPLSSCKHHSNISYQGLTTNNSAKCSCAPPPLANMLTESLLICLRHSPPNGLMADLLASNIVRYWFYQDWILVIWRSVKFLAELIFPIEISTREISFFSTNNLAQTSLPEISKGYKFMPTMLTEHVRQTTWC